MASQCVALVSHPVLCLVCSASKPLPASVDLTPASDCTLVMIFALNIDAVLPLPELPPPDKELRRQLLGTLTASPPPRSSWEVRAGPALTALPPLMGSRTGVQIVGRVLHGVLVC